MLELLVAIQRAIREALSANMEIFAASGSWSVLLAMLPLGVVFGAAHALTPGHSKTVLAAYAASSDIAPLRAAIASAALSVTHIASAILLALFANALVTRTVVGAGRAPALELLSRTMLAVAGLWLIVRAIRPRPHLHGEGLAVGIAAGLVPCPLTLFVMGYSMSRGIPEAGLMFSLSMFLGVATVLVTVAMTAVYAREFCLAAFQGRAGHVRTATRLLDGAAGTVLAAVSAFELWR